MSSHWVEDNGTGATRALAGKGNADMSLLWRGTVAYRDRQTYRPWREEEYWRRCAEEDPRRRLAEEEEYIRRREEQEDFIWDFIGNKKKGIGVDVRNAQERRELSDDDVSDFIWQDDDDFSWDGHHDDLCDYYDDTHDYCDVSQDY